jgi:integrase
MASVINRGNGRRAVQFENLDGVRKTLGLGKCHAKAAEAIASKIESILASRLSQQSLDLETAKWVGTLPDILHEKLAEVGLIESRSQKRASSIAAFVDEFIRKREADTKASTRTVYKRTRKHLVDFFGSEMQLAVITSGHASDFRRYLITQQLADNTVRRTCGFARQFFADAVERELIAKNPFATKSISVAVRGNAERFHFVTAAESEAVLSACPDCQTRLVFALARYGGLRTPSETLALRWSDIDWQAQRMTVRSPKTEHHEGKGSRVVPIFPELRPYLEEAFDPSNLKVVTIASDATKNFRTRFTRIIERAGLKPWPKLFQNLRVTRQTELSDQFPSHVVCEWMGNSQPVATKHYLHTTEEHFQRAVCSAAPALQKGAETTRNDSQSVARENRKTPEKQANPVNQGSFIIRRMDDRGLEPLTSTMSTWRSNQLS